MNKEYITIKKALQTKKFIKNFGSKKRQILEMRYGVGFYNKPHTLKEISLKFFISIERIRQIEAEAHYFIRHKFEISK